MTAVEQDRELQPFGPRLRGKVTRIFQEEGYGFIKLDRGQVPPAGQENTSGGDWFFHATTVQEKEGKQGTRVFDEMQPGDKVEFIAGVEPRTRRKKAVGVVKL